VEFAVISEKNGVIAFNPYSEEEIDALLKAEGVSQPAATANP
jgi:hypothetical protein